MTVQLVSRAQWGARAPKAVITRPLSEVVGACWHHTGSAITYLATMQMEMAAVRGVQSWCMDHNGYDDIDYEALIGPTGAVYLGRDVTVIEAAQSGTWAGRPANESLLGICFLGDFSPGCNALTAAAKQAAEALVYIAALGVGHAGGRMADHFSHHAFAKAHSPGFATVCPGGGGLARPHTGNVESFILGAFHATTE